MSFAPQPTMQPPQQRPPSLFANVAMLVVVGITGVAASIAFVIVLWWSFAAFSRYNARADAHNQTITAQKHVRIAQLEAQARYQTSIGLRRSQDEIRKTLTALYVQFELVQALQAIATSGKNNSIIYLPTNPTNGLPIVPTSNLSPGASK